MAKKSDHRWLLPTNTDNMRNIIAQGLITGPDGFSKYYEDTLELFKNWIPVFKNKIATEILKKCTQEVDGLIPCIIEFNTNMFSGNIKTLNNENMLIDFDPKNSGNDEVEILFVLAPLPLTCIKNVLFQNEKNKIDFENDAKLYSNVPLIDLNLQSTKTDQKLFFNSELSLISLNSLQDIEFPLYPENDYLKVYGYGGMLGMLFYFAKNGHLSNQLYHLICNNKELSEDYNENIQAIYNYFNDVDNIKNTTIQKMYYGLLDITVHNKNVNDQIVAFLENMDGEERFKKRAFDIATELRKIDIVMNKTVSEQFQEAKTPLEKSLLMLFIREDSDSLMDFHLDQFREEEYLQFAMMFGIRDKFISLPKSLREIKGLQKFISTKMADYAHRRVNTSAPCTPLAENPMTLSDMLRNEGFQKWFAKNHKIDHCFRTKINLPKGEYQLNILGSSVEIIIDGLVKDTTTEIIEEKLFKFMSMHNLESYSKYLVQYNKNK